MLHTILFVGLGLFLLIAVILYHSPWAKAKRIRKEEKRQQQKKEREEKERLITEQKARKMENLKKRHLVIYIDDTSDKKVEAVLINELLKLGVTVDALPKETGHAIRSGDVSSLKDGNFALIGTSWQAMNFGDGFSYQWQEIFCKYRLLEVGKDGKEKRLGEGCKYIYASDHEILARNIIGHISEILFEKLENK